MAISMQVGIAKSRLRDVATFHCVVFKGADIPTVIVDNEIPIPAERWELRTSGLWTDNICETPFAHWSYGLEAFGLAIDDPEEMLGRGYGQRVPLGWEFDFEGSPDRVDRLVPGGDGGAYSQPGHVDGLVLFGAGSEPLSGPAVRQHWWGPAAETPLDDLDRHASIDHPGSGPVAPSTPSVVGLPMIDRVWWVSRTGAGIDSRTEPAPQR
ncbi:MAG: hypothetical protein ACR2QK_04540 [Acidimicrobiales bacterium]